jgi:hypothetical protein
LLDYTAAVRERERERERELEKKKEREIGLGPPTTWTQLGNLDRDVWRRFFASAAKPEDIRSACGGMGCRHFFCSLLR